MTAAGFGDRPAAGRHGPSRRAARREPESAEAGFSAEIALQVGDALTQLGTRLRDPAVAHSVAEIEQVTRGFASGMDGMADGLTGITEWLRAAGHVGTVSAHASVLADRVAHVARELAILADAINEAEQRAP